MLTILRSALLAGAVTVLLSLAIIGDVHWRLVIIWMTAGAVFGIGELIAKAITREEK